MKNLNKKFIERYRKAFSACCLATLIACTASANEHSNQASKITPSTQDHVINLVSTKLTQGYVFPEKAKVITEKLQELQKTHHFEQFTDAHAFSAELTKKLQILSADKHLQVEYSPEPMPLAPSPAMLETQESHELAMWRAHNFGFERIERLPFNIGYLHLSAFGPTAQVGPLLASAMNLLANTDSLIIDLRGNFGGEEQTVSLLASYFFDKRTHLLTMYRRQGDKTEQHWSHDYVAGTRYSSDKDIYLLIDNDSFSAAEDFSYTMKHLTRATLIGETTGGAANSGNFVQLTPHFSMFLPTGRGISPITQTNWEGTGVLPDIKVASDQAFNQAQKVILNKLLDKENDERRQQRIKARISTL